MIRVLFVCLGNICRSPMAEAVFMHKVKAAGLEDRIEADSAGTGDWHRGQAPHRGTQQILKANEIAFSHCARQIGATDFRGFDYILTMDESNFADVNALLRSTRLSDGKHAHIARLMDFAPDAQTREVPDPYYDGRYTEVYTLVEQATTGLLEHILHLFLRSIEIR